MRIRQTGITRALAIGCMLACTATACSSAEGGSTSGPPTTITGSPASPDVDQYVSPLSEALGYGGSSTMSAEDEAEMDAQDQQVQDLTASCMQDQGFDYVPYIGEWSSSLDGTDPYALPPAEFAAQYGYGMSTIEYRPVTVDPNTAIVDAMSVAERSAYHRALYGDAMTLDPDGRPDLLDKPAAEAAAAAVEGESEAAVGCAVEASTEVYGSKSEVPVASGGSADAFAALETSMGALSESVENDPRVAEARTRWVSCMADRGHPGYAEKTDAPIDVGGRASELRGDANDFDDADPAAVAELRAYEISVAVADWDCGLDYDAVHQEVETELEEEFVEANRDELDQYRDALADGTAGRG